MGEPALSPVEASPPAGGEARNSAPPSIPVEWALAVAAATLPFRVRRSAHHGARALHAGADLSLRDWHLSRQVGQLERFERVIGCGSEWSVEGTCSACGTSRAHPVGCSVRRICPSCRGRAARKYRGMVRRVMAQSRKRHRWLTSRPRDRWGWRFLTLTMPHAEIGRDVHELTRRLWPAFLRRLRAHVRLDLGETKHAPVYVRVLEVTPGTHADGHAHLHVLLFSPYLDHTLIRMWWGQCLERVGRTVPSRDVPALLEQLEAWRARAVGKHLNTRRGPHGRPLQRVPWPVVDVRAVKGGDVADELVKYLVKDMSEGQRIPPSVAGRVYEALEGVRTLTATRELWAWSGWEGEAPCPCPDCSERAERSYRVVRADRERAPPPDGTPAPRLAPLVKAGSVEAALASCEQRERFAC